MYKYYNANPLGNIESDCVVRAISKAEKESWDTTYAKLSKLAQREGKILDNMDFVEEYLDKKYKRACHYSKTIEEFMREHRIGTYLVTMEGHITCIIDGTLYDTFDCRKRRMWCAWKIEKGEKK